MSRRTLLYVLVLLAALPSEVHAQADVHVYLDSTAQVIRGFGAANIVGWRPDMTRDEIETAFGVGEGQLGFSLLRLRLPPQENQWAVNLPTAWEAHARGVHLIASPWSPPAHMKTNNNLVGGRLRDDMYDDYARYLNAFNTYMQDRGAPLYAISVQNEPDIQVTYESCDWSPEEMRRFVAEQGASIGTRLMAPESFQFRTNMSDPLLNDSAAAANLDLIGGHIYGGGLAPYPLAQQKGKEVWMTEHLVVEADLAASLGTAVEIQRVMQAGMNAYIWWYIVRYYGPISDGEQGVYAKGEITKRGYFMSQFSRFIRPGHVRVHTEGTGLVTRVGRVYVTAYRDSSRVVVVAVNDSASPAEVRVMLEGGRVGRFTRYVTNATKNVEQGDAVEVVDSRFEVALDARSVTTFVSDDAASSGDEAAPALPAYQLFQSYPNPFSADATIAYTVPRAGEVTLEVFDLLGRNVATLVDGVVAAGRHQATFTAPHLPAGVYVYRLRAGGAVQTRRMTLVR